MEMFTHTEMFGDSNSTDTQLMRTKVKPGITNMHSITMPCQQFPTMPVTKVAKELGRKKNWKNKENYQTMAAEDKERYELEKTSIISALDSIVAFDGFQAKKQ
ncbi:hypothetical protein HELRODRAFT_183534 [Helobdella robusta]|uniref:Uncharacterized protein n=1 Tax=Helobdella robusta TaxID=6412 RepID=T1FJT1_HELRO|nr:hypothetical protein HELRODRAFT_183534 [Helobdella robusta]ESO10505.1 hypothetical protein HELRODRAFT_183534 [Helobdella robusta]